MNTTTPQEETVLAAPQKRPLLAWGLLVLMALVWGTSFILIKHSLVHFPVVQVASGRIFFAFLFFLPLMIRQYRQPETRAAVKACWPALLTSGLLGYFLPAHLFAEAGAHLNSSLAGALNSLSPLFTLVIGAAFFMQPVRRKQIFGILLGLSGSLLLVFLGSRGEMAFNGYALLVVVATLMYGININVISKYLAQLPALVSTAWTFAFVGPLAGISLFSTDFLQRAAQPEARQSLFTLVFLGVVASGITSVLFNRVVQLTSGVFASSVTYLMPVVALMWGLFDSEVIVAQQYLGMAICLAGVYLVNKK